MMRLVTLASGAWLLACGYAAFVRYQNRSKRFQKLLDQYKQSMLPPVSRLVCLKNDILQEMTKGLRKQGDGSLLLLPTFVTQLPTGDEVGECYAIDLGGTNFRVVYVKLSPTHGGVEEWDIHQVAIPKDCYTGSREQLFDFIATAVQGFMETRAGGATSPRKHSTRPVVGFCFSFPMVQQALDEGLLLDWTKGFSCPGVVGHDVVALLSEAFERAGCPCRIAALLNDTVGLLAASRYQDQDTLVSIIIGTGTNACYVERVANIPKWRPEGVPESTDTIINIEWGSYNSDLLPYVEEDHAFDAISHSPGKYMFEKFIAGMCLGEVARLILLRFAREVQLFGICVPAALERVGSFPTASLATIEEDSSLLLLDTRAELRRQLGVTLATPAVLKTVQEICQMVGRRSATMVATGLAAVLAKAGFEERPRRVVVAFDGGVYEKYAKYREMLDKALCSILGARAAELRPLIELRYCRDGSVMGGAVLASAAAAATAAAAAAEEEPWLSEAAGVAS